VNGTLPSGDRRHRSGTARRHSDVLGLLLAYADWHAELRILQNEKRRQVLTRRRVGNEIGDAQPLTE
jgi:hypothetical protein